MIKTNRLPRPGGQVTPIASGGSALRELPPVNVPMASGAILGRSHITNGSFKSIPPMTLGARGFFVFPLQRPKGVKRRPKFGGRETGFPVALKALGVFLGKLALVFVPMTSFTPLGQAGPLRPGGARIPLRERSPEVAFLTGDFLMGQNQSEPCGVMVPRCQAGDRRVPGPGVRVVALQTGTVPSHPMGRFMAVLAFFAESPFKRFPPFLKRFLGSVRQRVAFLTTHFEMSVAQGIKLVVVEQGGRTPSGLGMALGAIRGGPSGVGIPMAIRAHLP